MVVEKANVGIWSWSTGDISKDGVYTGRDPEVLLLQSLLISLKVKNLTWVSVSQSGWFNLTDKSSLASQIRDGFIDIHSSFMIFTADRFNLFSFAYPFTYEHMSLAVVKHSPATTYLRLISSFFWGFTFMALFLAKLLLMSQDFFVPTLLRKLRLSSLVFVLFSVGISATLKFYKINLTALAVAPNAEVPVTLRELANQLETGTYRLVDKSTSNFVFEDVNKSDSHADFAILKKALAKFPPYVLSVEEICSTVANPKANELVKYVYLNTEENIKVFCDRYFSQFQLIPIQNSGFYTRSYIFSPNSTELRKKITRLASDGNLAIFRYHLSLRKAKAETSAPKRTGKFKKSESFNNSRQLTFYRQVFQLFFGALAVCTLAWALENVGSKI